LARVDKIRYHKELLEMRKQNDSGLMIEDEAHYLKQMIENCGKLKILDKMLFSLKKNGHKVFVIYSSLLLSSYHCN
jgi:hypothetical protein